METFFIIKISSIIERLHYFYKYGQEKKHYSYDKNFLSKNEA